MKKLNEGPTIKTDHKGSHLTNADGEVVQSFAKDRAGLKDARQAMYKNYKGLNMKKPEPEPEQPVEEMKSTETVSENEFTVFPSKASKKGDYSVMYSIHQPLMVARITRWANKNGITVQKYDTNKFIVKDNELNHSSMVRFLRNEGINGDATVMNSLVTSKEKGFDPDDVDFRQDYDIDNTGHFVTDNGEESLGGGISARIQQRIQQDNQRYYEDKKMSELENKLKEQLEEGIVVNTTSDSDANVEDTITVTAQGADAMELMNMLKMAGIGSQEAEVEAPAEETPCCDATNDIDAMADMIKIIPLDDIKAVEEEAELANAPDEKYADTDTLVNKISGGLNRRKKAYAKAENGDNPMAVNESAEELTARLLKEYDEFKVTSPEDSDEGDWEIENVGKWAVKIGKTQETEATDDELELPFDAELAGALADKALEEDGEFFTDDDYAVDNNPFELFQSKKGWEEASKELIAAVEEASQMEDKTRARAMVWKVQMKFADFGATDTEANVEVRNRLGINESINEDDVEEGLRIYPKGRTAEKEAELAKQGEDKKATKVIKPKDALDKEMSEDKS